MRPTTSKSRTLSGITDLTLLAPVKAGLIESIDSRSYASRARLTLRTLNSLRLSSREAEPTPLVADLVDRVQAIHSFRVVLLERQVLLNVVFDGGWEPYMRRIWRDLGPLLDLIFCNCEGYLLSVESSFAAYAAWVRSVQVETEFFYTAAPVTVGDLHYLRRVESVRAAAGAPTPGPSPAPIAVEAKTLGGLLSQALPAVVALYRLSDMHPHDPASPQAGDGGCLLRAAWRVLGHLPGGLAEKRFATEVAAEVDLRAGSERAALEWFYRGQPAGSPEPGNSAWSRGNVQGGIVEPYPSITHGCLVLVGLRDANAARALLDYLLVNQRLISAADVPRSPSSAQKTYHNVAFTLQGLQVVGVPVGSLATMPAEFREGMAARAGILGDVDTNHPTRWDLPRANWDALGGSAAGTPIELTGVHAVVQIQAAGKSSADWEDLPRNQDHPLYPAVELLGKSLQEKGVRILTVQAMQRFLVDGGQTREAFGFVDGISQPRLEDGANAVDERDRVSTGDLLLGYRNGLGDEPVLRGRLWDDGTFVVVRKLRQDVKAFEATADDDAKKTALMGRSPEGDVLGVASTPITGNKFDFSSDPLGNGCPLASHIRRANPRETRRPDLPTVPRILRRGMSWGPRKGDGPRGVLFIAYNASIAEQFEVIQGWLAGGNSSGRGLYSGDRDPLVGVPLAGDPSVVRYDGFGKIITLPPGRPFAKLEWGMYLFAPSMAALTELRALADEAVRLDESENVTETDERERRWRQTRTAVAQAGAAAINQLRRVEQVQSVESTRDLWKIALEDISARLSGTTEAVWAAVADVHGGALRTPYGVLVGDAKLVQEVLADTDQRYTASGYNSRLKQSFGEIFLGMDDRPDSEYAEQARGIDAQLRSVSEADAFATAFRLTGEAVSEVIAGLTSPATRRVEVRDLIDATLAKLSRDWFGIPDGTHVVEGGWHWNKAATCPGHFVAPSRYTFQPNPGVKAQDTGKAHGCALAKAVTGWFQSLPSNYTHKPIVQAIVDTTPTDVDNQVRNLIGVMMGFLPTVDGNLRGALWEWVEDRSLWELQLDLLESLKDLAAPEKLLAADRDSLPAADRDSLLAAAREVLTMPLARTLHLRPVPEMVWRMVTGKKHKLGGVDVEPGDVVVVGLVGALQQRLADNELDLSFLFGGYRKGVRSADEIDLTLLMNPADTGRPAKAPTHACPAYRMAWGVMLGFLARLLCTARLRPTLTSMSLQIGPRP